MASGRTWVLGVMNSYLDPDMYSPSLRDVVLGRREPSRVVGEGGVPVVASQSLATQDFTCELIPDSFLSPKTVKIGESKILSSGHLTRGRQVNQPAFSQDWD